MAFRTIGYILCTTLLLGSVTSLSLGLKFHTWTSGDIHGAFSRGLVRAPLRKTLAHIKFPRFIDLTMKNFAFQTEYLQGSHNVLRVVDESGEWFDINVLDSRIIRRRCIAFEIVNASPKRFPYPANEMDIMFYACARRSRKRRRSSYRRHSVIHFFSRLRMPLTADEVDAAIMNNMLGSILATWAENAERKLKPSACSNRFRSISGYCNNVRNPSWGASKHPLLRQRKYDPDYSSPDGSLSFRYNQTASTREISLVVASQSKAKPEPSGLTDLFTIWGQLIDHDITMVAAGSQGGVHERIDIEVDRQRDPVFNQTSLSLDHLRMDRSSYDRSSYNGRFESVEPRNQVNRLTGFVDASFVYGSSIQRASALRSYKDGKMLTSKDGMFLPKNEPRRLKAILENSGGNSPELFAAGDVRSNENPVLAFLHFVMLKEHNRLCDEIKKAFPRYSDQTLYNYARMGVIAEVQAITFEQWLPLLLGTKKLPKYTGYNAEVNPSINAYFQTFAFRFGHSMINMNIAQRNCQNKEAFSSIPLSQTLFNPRLISDLSPEVLLCGAAYQRAQQVDSEIVHELQNILFSISSFEVGVDLYAFNVQRTFDHGIPAYNNLRRSLYLPPKTKIADIAKSSSVAEKLAQAYSGKVENVDAFSGSLSEDKVYGSPLGETLHWIIWDQFRRLRDGDRFYFRRKRFPSYLKRRVPELHDIEGGKYDLGDILARNTNLKRSELPSNVFRL